MEELQAKWTFDQGGFAKAMIVPTLMGAGYHLGSSQKTENKAR